MTAESLCAELRELYKFRNAIDIIADRHDCTYTDIITLIGNTPEFDRFDSIHSERVPAPRYKSKWDKSIEPHIVRMYNSGYSSREIAVKYEVSETTINRHLKQLGVTIRKQPILGAHMYDDIKRLYDDGASYEQLAQRYHVKRQTVVNFMAREEN